MAKLSTIPEQTRQQLEQIGTVDLVIGLVDEKASANIVAIAGIIRQGLERLSKSTRTVIMHRNSDSAAAALSQGELEDDSLRLLSYSLPAPDPSLTVMQSTFNAYRTVGEISQDLSSRACVVLASSPASLTPEWIYGLAQPILERDYDLVTPCYLPHKFEGLLNNAILCPLIRALYGKQIQNPLGPDLGFSARLSQDILHPDPARVRGASTYQPLLIGTEAIVRGHRVCQAHLGMRIYPPIDWKNLDSILAAVLDPLFLGVERDAPFWQHIRSSEGVATYGAPFPFAEESVTVDVRRLLELFKLGVRNLQDIWGLVLPPAALLELRKVDRLSPEQFRIPDELWVRIVYDFALAYRLRTIGRDHLLRALTPLYLGWVASYAVEVEPINGAAVQRRLERLDAAYETGKPYLVSRWRWPDRFNP